MTDHNLREIASGCEAKLHGVRRTADGVVVSFVLHPAEIPPALMLDPLGTRYQLAFVAISDDEQPITASHRQGAERPLSVTRPVQQGAIHPDDMDSSVLDGGAKSSEQPGCGIAESQAVELVVAIGAIPAGTRGVVVHVWKSGSPQDETGYEVEFTEPGPCVVTLGRYDFRPVPTEAPGIPPTTAGLTPKARYAAMTAGEQAVQRAGILAGDPRFQAWACRAGWDDLAESPPSGSFHALTEEQASNYIRNRCCGGKSRKLIAEDPEAMDKFIVLETAFKIAVGEMAEPR